MHALSLMSTQGSAIVYVAALPPNGKGEAIIAKPEIASFADLKGKRIGLSLPVDTISISMRRLLALKGLPEADYQVKELVGTPVRFDCLKRGECDAVPLGQPDDLIALQQGYRRLGDSTESIAAFQFQVIAARRAWAQANKDNLVRFLRALGLTSGLALVLDAIGLTLRLALQLVAALTLHLPGLRGLRAPAFVRFGASLLASFRRGVTAGLEVLTCGRQRAGQQRSRRHDQDLASHFLIPPKGALEVPTGHKNRETGVCSFRCGDL